MKSASTTLGSGALRDLESVGFSRGEVVDGVTYVFLPFRNEDHLHVPVGVEVGLRGVVNFRGGQHCDAVRHIGDGGEIRGVAVFVSAGGLVSEGDVVLTCPLSKRRQSFWW